MPKASSIIKYALTLLLAAFFVTLAVWKVDWKAFAEGLLLTRWSFIILFVLASICALVLRMFRWQVLLLPVCPQAGKLRIWDANNVGNLANIAVPGSGEFVRCGYVSAKGGTFQSVLGTCIMERVLDLMAIAVLFALALFGAGDSFLPFFKDKILNPLLGRLGDATLWLIVCLCVVLFAAFVVLSIKLKDRSRVFGAIYRVLKGLYDGFVAFGRSPHKILTLVYTVGIWTMYVLMSYFILKAMPELSSLGLLDALFLSAVGNVASVIPVPGSIGAYHYLVAMCLSGIWAYSWETGLLFATLNHELHAVVILILGIISQINLSRKKSAAVGGGPAGDGASGSGGQDDTTGGK